MPHPRYSPDLVPRDFFLFLNMKTRLTGKKFTSNEQIITETEDYFAEFDKLYFLQGIIKLKNRWAKCIELKGD